MQCCITVWLLNVQTILMAVSVLKISLPTMPTCFYAQNNDTLHVCFAICLMISDYLGI